MDFCALSIQRSSSEGHEAIMEPDTRSDLSVILTSLVIAIPIYAQDVERTFYPIYLEISYLLPYDVDIKA